MKIPLMSSTRFVHGGPGDLPAREMEAGSGRESVPLPISVVELECLGAGVDVTISFCSHGRNNRWKSGVWLVNGDGSSAMELRTGKAFQLVRSLIHDGRGNEHL